jgi:hypothetical protein
MLFTLSISLSFSHSCLWGLSGSLVAGFAGKTIKVCREWKWAVQRE